MKRICMLLLVVTAVLFATSPLYAGETKLGGVVFANWQLHLNNQGLGKNYNAFDITRARLIIDHKFSEKYEANIMTDIFTSSTDDGNGFQCRIRSAYFQVNKPLRYTDVRFGMHGLLWYDKVESIWGLRYIDPVSLDKLGPTSGGSFISRADIGASIIGQCPGGYGDLAVQVLNGGGFTEQEMNKYKDFAIVAFGYPLPKDPDFGESGVLAQYYKGWPNITNTATAGQSFSKNTKKDRLQFAGVFKYRKWVTGYGEYFVTWDDADVTNGTEKEFVDKCKGFFLLGRLNVATSETWLARVYLFGKYEWIDRHLQLTEQEDQLRADDGDARHLIAGVGYEPVDGYHLAITIKRDTVTKNDRDIQTVEEEANSVMFNMTATF